MYGRPLSQSRYVFVQQNYQPLQSAIVLQSYEKGGEKYKMTDLVLRNLHHTNHALLQYCHSSH